MATSTSFDVISLLQVRDPALASLLARVGGDTDNISIECLSISVKGGGFCLCCGLSISWSLTLHSYNDFIQKDALLCPRSAEHFLLAERTKRQGSGQAG